MFSYLELLRRYRSLLNFKHRWIQKTGFILLTTALSSGLMWLLTVNFGYKVCSSEKVLLVVSIILNILWQYFAVMGIFIIVSYMLWHIALQIYDGVKRIIWIIILICTIIIAVVFLPTIYRSEIGDLIYNREGGLNVTKDLKYIGEIISASDKTETKTVTINGKLGNTDFIQVTAMNYFSLYYVINVSGSIARSEYVIMSCADAQDMQNELDSKGLTDVLVTYNVDTRLVINYVLVENFNNGLDVNGQSSANVEIWLEEKDNGIILICRPEIMNYNDNLYWYLTKDGQFYQNRVAYFKPSDNILSFVEEGEYTVTLVVGYNESTGEYTPISNTIEYTVE